MRLLINDLNVNAARKALANLRDNKEFYGLSQKALARSIGDQLYGFNLTRAYTLAGREKGLRSVLSVGRVQTPILGLIVNRYLAFKNHAAASFFNVTAQMDFPAGDVPAKLIVPPTTVPTATICQKNSLAKHRRRWRHSPGRYRN